MSVHKKMLLVAVVWACASAGQARAADVQPVPVYSTAPAALAAGPCVSQAGCGTCATGLSRFTAGFRGAPSCNKSLCDTRWLHLQHRKEPYVVTLCPGACFGYFQTQWRKWDDVCPYPYQGSGVGDAARGPVPYLPSASDRPPQDPKKNGNGLPPPRVVDPKTGMPIPPPNGGGLPQIPQYPGPGGRY